MFSFGLPGIGGSGSVELVYPDFLPPPNVAHASAYSDDGHSSRTARVGTAKAGVP